MHFFHTITGTCKQSHFSKEQLRVCFWQLPITRNVQPEQILQRGDGPFSKSVQLIFPEVPGAKHNYKQNIIMCLNAGLGLKNYIASKNCSDRTPEVIADWHLGSFQFFDLGCWALQGCPRSLNFPDILHQLQCNDKEWFPKTKPLATVSKWRDDENILNFISFFIRLLKRSFYSSFFLASKSVSFHFQNACFSERSQVRQLRNRLRYRSSSPRLPKATSTPTAGSTPGANSALTIKYQDTEQSKSSGQTTNHPRS